MQFTLRLYYPYDIDLIALRFVEGSGFAKKVRQCLSSFAYSGDFTWHVPRLPSIQDPSEVYRVGIKIDEASDTNLATYISQIDSKNQSKMVKFLIRASFDNPPLYLFRDPKLFPPPVSDCTAAKAPATPEKEERKSRTVKPKPAVQKIPEEAAVSSASGNDKIVIYSKIQDIAQGDAAALPVPEVKRPEAPAKEPPLQTVQKTEVSSQPQEGQEMVPAETDHRDTENATVDLFEMFSNL